MVDRARQILEALGRVIAETREAEGLTQVELGQRSGLEQSYVGRLERARLNAGLTVWVRVSNGLGVPLSELVRRAEARVEANRRQDVEPSGHVHSPGSSQSGAAGP